MKIRIIAGAVMALLALAGLAIISTYVGTADARALEDQEPREVYLVTAPILEGTPVEEFGESVTLHTVPAAIVPDGAVTDLGEHSGSVAGVDLQPGEQLLDSRLVDPQALEEPGTVPVPEGSPRGHHPARRAARGGRSAGGRGHGRLLRLLRGRGGPGVEDGQGPAQGPGHLRAGRAECRRSGRGEGHETPAADAPAVPEGTMLVTFAVNADTAEKIVYASEFGRIWLSLEPEGAEENDNGATRGDFE